MTETEAIRQNYNLGVLAGAAQERKRLVELLTARVCFDHLETNDCTHSQCFNNMDMVARLRDEK